MNKTPEMLNAATPTGSNFQIVELSNASHDLHNLIGRFHEERFWLLPMSPWTNRVYVRRR